MNTRELFICLVVLMVALSAHADDLASKFVGKSSCDKELWGPTGNYGIRLDRNQNAYLAAHTVRGANLLMIVKYATKGDKCGVIKDVVASKDVRNHFEFVCVDCNSPSIVVVGTCPETNKAQIGAVEAWQVDVQNMKFVPTTAKVTCVRRNYKGSDKGYDLATWARKGVEKNCSSLEK